MRKSNLGQIKNYWREKISALDLDLILSDAINQPREFVITHPEFKPNLWQILKIYFNITRRINGVPLAYITEHKEFFGLDFFVNKNVLVPRPDTEILVGEAINLIDDANAPVILIDVGTGSGCIPISIAKNTPAEKIHKIMAVDVSDNALKVAKKNAKKHGVKIDFIESSLLTSVIPDPVSQYGAGPIEGPVANNPQLIITANLPYLTNKQFNDEKSIQKEPKLALVADDVNGLSLYKKLLKQIKSLITCHPDANRDLCPITILLEIDPNQTTEIREFIKNIFPKTKLEIKKDLAGLDRIVIINSLPPPAHHPAQSESRSHPI